MPTPRLGYFTADGTKVPSVTTVISNCKLGGAEGLLYWANKVGHEAEHRNMLAGLPPLTGAGRSHREERDKAADAGTCAHDMVESDIRGWDFDSTKYDPMIVDIANGAFKAYKEWAKQTKLKTFATEVGLVSERHKYGGTMDAMLVNGELSLGDWKTSGSVYVDMLIQLAAYSRLWEENNPDQKITGGFHLLRFSKPSAPTDPVHFSHHYWGNLDLAWDAFLHMRELYTLGKRLDKML